MTIFNTLFFFYKHSVFLDQRRYACDFFNFNLILWLHYA